MFGKNPSENYVPVQRSKTHAIKTNAIHTLLGELAKAKDPLVVAFDLLNPKNQIIGSQREAYILNFNTPPLAPLFVESGFVFCDRHLSVDKWYSLPSSENGACGYAAAHYTENYTHSNGSKKTLHVYFTENGTYTQIKIFEKDKEHQDRTPLSPITKNNIEQNTFAALDLYSQLNNARANRWTKKSVQADELEEQLSLHSAQLSKPSSLNNYIDLAEKFILLVAEINQLDDFKVDCRGERIQERLNYAYNLKKKSSSSATPLPPVKKPEAAKAEHEQNPKPDDKANSTVTASTSSMMKASSKNPQELLFTNLQQLSQQLDSAKETNNMASYISIATQIRLALIEYHFVEKISADEQTLIKNLKNKTASIQKPDEFAIKLFKEGNLGGFKTLYVVLTQKQERILVTTIFDELINQDTDTGQLAENQRSICEYLFENSSAYKFNVILENFALRYDKNLNVSVSQLYRLSVEDKLNTFDMLLRHGLNPNKAGLITDNVCLSLLRVCILNDIPEPYIKSLIKYGATLDIQDIKTKNDYTAFNALKKEMFKNDTKHIPPTSNVDLLNIFNTTSPFESDLVAACSRQRFELIPLLIEKSSLPYVLISFSYITYINMNKRYITNASLKQIVFQSKKDCDNGTMQLEYKPNSLQSCYFPLDNKVGTIDKQLEIIKLMLKFMDEKINTQPEELEKLLAILDDLGKKADKKGLFYTHIARTELISRVSPLNAEWATKLMHSFSCLATASLGIGLKPWAQWNYKMATQIGEEYGLKNHDVYKYAQKMFDALSKPGLFQTKGSDNSASSASTASSLSALNKF